MLKKQFLLKFVVFTTDLFYLFIVLFEIFVRMAVSKTYLQILFGQHIKHLRVEQGLTQVELSSRMNKDQQSLQRIESGNVSPNLFYLYNLSLALDISLGELLEFEVKRERKKDAKNKK